MDRTVVKASGNAVVGKTQVAFIVVGSSSPQVDWTNIMPLLPDKISFSLFSRIGVALIGIYFTYSGWTVLAYVAGEVKDPKNTIPRATFLGVISVVILYVLVNLVYLLAIPLIEMRNIVDIGYQAFETLWGGGLTTVFSAMILIAVTSTLNSTILFIALPSSVVLNATGFDSPKPFDEILEISIPLLVK